MKRGFTPLFLFLKFLSNQKNMKIVTHKFRIKEDQTCYLVNLVDHSGHPLESHVAMNNKEKSEISEELARKHIAWCRTQEAWIVPTVFHNSGFSIIE